jgi:hypothetical protein
MATSSAAHLGHRREIAHGRRPENLPDPFPAADHGSGNLPDPFPARDHGPGDAAAISFARNTQQTRLGSALRLQFAPSASSERAHEAVPLCPILSEQ